MGYRWEFFLLMYKCILNGENVGRCVCIFYYGEVSCIDYVGSVFFVVIVIF